MKLTKFINKKTIAILAVALFATGAAVGTTVAYLKDTTDTLTNTFEVGSVETELLEVVSGSDKAPYVYNAGKNECYVRIRATVSSSTEGELQALVNGLDTENNYWEHVGDYYYYKEPLAVGAITEKPLFTSVNSTNMKAGSFEIQLYQEAVQTTVTKADGTVITGKDEKEKMMNIWKFYEAQNESNK